MEDKIIRLDRASVEVRGDRRRRHETANTVKWGGSCSRVNHYSFLEPLTLLCLEVEPCRISLDGLSWWVDDILFTKDQFLEQFSPLKLNDVVCLAESWQRHVTGDHLVSVKFDPNKTVRPFSTMPPHLGPNYLITSNCIGVWEMEKLHHHEGYAPHCVTSMVKKHFWIYPVKGVE